MPRNTAPKQKMNAWPNVLRFIASLLFLYVIFAGQSMGWWSQWVSSGAGSVWLPILFGAAVLATIGLFFSSLAGIAMPNMKGGAMSMKVMMLASFTLVALTASPAWSTGFWIVILGFLIGWFGSAMEMMM